MSDEVRDLLVRGVAAAKANEKDQARFYLEWVLRREDKDPEQAVDALLWLSQLADNPADKREYLENILVLDPAHPLARRGMAILDGRLKPQDVMNPDQPVQPIKPDATPAAFNVRRYICLKCGGKMAYDAKRRSLSCGYCGHQMWEYQAVMSGALATVDEQDFFATLPTASAHRWELPTARTLTCQGCGAVLALSPLQISGACPFCDSPHVVGSNETRELIQPEGVLPFQFDDNTALHYATRWLKKRPFRPDDLDRRAVMARPRGVYMPFWTFDMGGELKWRAVYEDDRQVLTRNDLYLVSEDDLLIPASHSLPLDLLNKVADFDTKALAPYSPDFLADWATEIYQLPMSDAALIARQRVVEAAKKHIREIILGDKNLRELTCSTLGMIVETFKLVLLPVWMTSYQYGGKRYPVALNGQTGQVAGTLQRNKAQKLLAWVLGEA